MTMENETGRSSVKIATNSKGEAQVEVKVYQRALAPGEIFVNNDGYSMDMAEIADLCVDVRDRMLKRVVEKGGKVAGG